MKIAVTGKGGVGKTTFAATLARLYADEGKHVLAADVETGGGGCVCPENVMLRRIINKLVLHRDDVVIMDMEAGLEHLGRGTTESMDQFIVVIEPGARSVQTYKNVKRLADDLGVRQVRVVANKVRNAEDEEFVRSRIPAEDFLGFIHYNTEVMDGKISLRFQQYSKRRNYPNKKHNRSGIMKC